MADLLDIAPAAAVEAVHISSAGKPVDVRRLRVDDLAALAVRFPKLLVLFSRDGDSLAALMRSPGPELIAIIAAGCGHIGDEKSEAVVGSFAIEDQFKLLNAIFRLTFPNGLSSVMQEVDTLGRLLIDGATETPKPVKMRLKQSPSPSPPLSGADSHQTMS